MTVSSLFQMLTWDKLPTTYCQTLSSFFGLMWLSGFCFLISVCLKYPINSKVLWILSLKFFPLSVYWYFGMWFIASSFVSSTLQISLHISVIFLKHQFHPSLVYLKTERFPYDVSQAAKLTDVLFMIFYNLIKLTHPAIFPATLQHKSYV